MIYNKRNLLNRYLVATLGLALVAFGVALSIISDLGTGPLSCPTVVGNLWMPSMTIGNTTIPLTVGVYTVIMHLIFILMQIILLRKDFQLRSLMQIPASFVFGFFTDISIWSLQWVVADTYAIRMGLCLFSIIVTAFGISLEVLSKAWMLAGEETVAAIAKTGKWKFEDVKVAFDTALVVLSAIASYAAFSNAIGDGSNVVIREGTILLAVLTGLLMKLTDPIAKKMFGKITSVK